MLVIDEADVRRLLDTDALIDALAGVFVELSAGRASVPPRIAAQVPDRGMLVAMPGHVSGILASKLVSVFPGNHAVGLPSHLAVILLFDEATGAPLALMDGTHVTAARTAAASALATRLLAREDAATLAILGAGVQGRSHLYSVARVRDFTEVRVASRNHGHAAALAADFSALAVGSFEEAVRGADVVCACTDSPEPVVRRHWLKPGVHVNSVGFARGGPELDAGTVRAGLLAVVSRSTFDPYPAGPHELQGLDRASAVELGEILAGTRPGRSRPGEITVYKSAGHAVEDAAAARLVYDGARAAGRGTDIQVVPVTPA